MRRTEVRPILSRRAISALATPARRSFRISAAFSPAVIGRPRRLPFCRACASPARVRSRKNLLLNSAEIASRPVTDRPQRFQTPDQHGVDLAAARGFHQLLTSLSPDRSGANIAHLHGDGPTRAGRHIPAWCGSACGGLLVGGRHAGGGAGPEHFRRFPCPAKNPMGFWFLRRPVFRPFSSDAPAWPESILSGQEDSSYYAAAGVASRASVSR